MKTSLKIYLAIFLFAPIFTFGAGVTNIIDAASGIITRVLIPLAFALCLFYFFWGIAKYVKSQGDKESKDAKNVMMWGVIGIFVAFSIWGIVYFIQGELGIPGIDNIDKPGIESADINIKYGDVIN